MSAFPRATAGKACSPPWAVPWPTPGRLTVDSALGLLLILGAVNLVIRAALMRLRPVAWLSAAALLAIVGAAVSGAAFVGSSADGGFRWRWPC